LLHTDAGSAWRALRADDPREELEAIPLPVARPWAPKNVQLRLDDAFRVHATPTRAPTGDPGCGHLLIGERPQLRPRIATF